MGFALVPADLQDAYRAEHPGHHFIQPQQLQMVDTLDNGYDSYVVEVPRRASKTTTIFILLIGRCARRPGYQVTFSAQDGVSGSRRLREWAMRLDAINPPDDQDLPPWMRGAARPKPKRETRAVSLFGEDFPGIEAAAAAAPQRRGFRILKGEVGKGIYFENGSTFLVLRPDAGSVRGEAADVSWVDEFQEVEPAVGDDLLAGILPLQDTKPGSSIVMSGTAGEVRVGPFWQYIDWLRNSNPDVGGIDFAAPEDTPWEVIEDEERAMSLLQTVHPGVGTLTTMDKMRKNYRKLPHPQWAREYLSIWPETFGVSAVNPLTWAAGAVKAKPIPDRVAFGFDVRPGGSAGAICAAWRDSRGNAYVEVIAHQAGTLWIPKFVQGLSAKYRGSTVAYDDIGEGKATATEVQNLRPKPRIRVQTYRDHAAGCVQFMRDLERGRLKHFGQASLNAAIECAGKREVRGDAGIWLWTNASEGDISPVVAATRALRNWDMYYAQTGRKRTGVVTPK